MTKAIYLDMDGTIANLYGVDGWLDCIINEYTKNKEVKRVYGKYSYYN